VLRRDGIARASGLVLGFAADAVFADPARRHPVAGFGQVAGALERRLWRDDRRAGATFTALAVGGPLLLGVAVERAGRGRPLIRLVTTAAATWVVLGASSLINEGAKMARLLTTDDIAGARGRLGHLCARDASALASAQLARATVESLAENTSDAVVAPLVWGALAGIPGLLTYRAVNTLDAMVGYHNPRYEHFGWASARVDDLVNLAPARITAGLVTTLAPVVGGSRSAARRVVQRDGRHHPSPNAGLVEAAFAGALGVRLGGVNRYGDTVEDRGELGDGPPPVVADIARVARLSRLAGVAATVLAALTALLAGSLVGRGARPDRVRR
jgi:adenosylcobinamide-phosphate synthase